MAQSHAHRRLHKHHNWLIICAVLLIILLGVVVLKYSYAKSMWYGHSVKLQDGIQKYVSLNSIEDAETLATTITTIPSGLPLFRQPAQLQEYIVGLGEDSERSIVVVDKNKVILADTVEENVGKPYNLDVNGEIGKTMFDGVARSFIEKSTEYPDGINQTVVQMKDKSGAIVGAVIISSSNIFK